MNPLAFLDVARALSNSDREEDRRTAVGRSYYAVFNHLRLKVQLIRSLPGDLHDHRALVVYLTTANNRDLQSVGQDLKDLRSSRNLADYSMGESVETAQSQLALKKAERAVSKFGDVGEVRLKTAILAVPPFRPEKR